MNAPAETSVLQIIIIITVAATLALVLHSLMPVSRPTMIAVPCDCAEI